MIPFVNGGSGSASADPELADVDITTGTATTPSLITAAQAKLAATTHAPAAATYVQSRLLGRGASSGTGVAEVLTVGSGLTLTGTTLTASGAAAPSLTNGDITTGTATTASLITAAQAKLAVNTWAPAQTDGAITTGSSTTQSTISAAQAKLAAQTWAPAAPTYAQNRVLGRGAASGTGIAEVLTLGTNLSLTGTTLNAASPASLTDGDITTGTATTASLITAAQAKLAAQTHAPAAPTYVQARLLGRGASSGTGIAEVLTVGTNLTLTGTVLAATSPPSLTNGDITTGSATTASLITAAQAKLAAETWAPAPTESFIVALSDQTTALTTGTAKVTMRMPYAFTLTAVRASCSTAPTGATIIVDINEGGTTILSTKLSIDATEKTSTTAATAAVISDASLADDAELTFDIDQVGSTVAGAGLKVTLIGHR